MVNFGPLTAETGWRILCTPANFYGFLVLASLPHRRRSTEVNQALHDVWPYLGLVHIYRYTFLSPNGILPSAKFTLCPSLAYSYISSITALHSSSAYQPNFVACFGRRPPRGTSVPHLLVFFCNFVGTNFLGSCK